MSSLLLGFCLSLAVPAVPSSAPSPAVAGPASPGAALDDGPSLETLLEMARAEREARRALLAPAVQAGVARLEELAERQSRSNSREEEPEVEAPQPAEIEAAIHALVELGEEAAPLLIAQLDPINQRGRRRAAWVAQALARMPLEAALTELIQVATVGAPEARLHAVALLPLAGEPERVAPLLIELYRGSDEPVAAVAIAGLAYAGDNTHLPILSEALGDTRDLVVASALNGLAKAAHSEAEPLVRQLANSRDGTDCVPQLIAYYRAVPELADDDLVSILIRLATRPGTRESDKLRILVALPTYERRFEREWRDQMQPLVQSGDDDVSLEAEICLACMGDRTARRELIERYDEWVLEANRYSKSWAERGSLLMRLGDYRGAIRDYEEAIEKSRSSPQAEVPYWIELARAHMLDDDVRGAYECLSESPLQRADRQRLTDDSDFAALRDHTRYGEILH